MCLEQSPWCLNNANTLSLLTWLRGIESLSKYSKGFVCFGDFWIAGWPLKWLKGWKAEARPCLVPRPDPPFRRKFLVTKQACNLTSPLTTVEPQKEQTLTGINRISLLLGKAGIISTLNNHLHCKFVYYIWTSVVWLLAGSQWCRMNFASEADTSLGLCCA